MSNSKLRVSRLPLPLAVGLVLMALVSIPLHADSYSFYLGPQPNPTPSENGESVGPYPGTLKDTTTSTTLPFVQFMCLDGNVTTNWGTTLTGGTLTHPVTQQDDEAAFLASLLLADAAAQGVTLPSNSAPNPSASYTQTFIDAYAGPITFAIWQIMGTLPSGVTEPSGASAYVTQAQAEYTNVFTNAASPYHAASQTFLSNVEIFTPNPQGSAQRFITMGSFASVPEPGTLGLLAAGLLLAGLNRKRLAGLGSARGKSS